jgi:hypothetical protein
MTLLGGTPVGCPLVLPSIVVPGGPKGSSAAAPLGAVLPEHEQFPYRSHPRPRRWWSHNRTRPRGQMAEESERVN